MHIFRRRPDYSSKPCPPNNFGSPQMWVWPQLVFGGYPPSPIAIGGPFPQAKAPPSPRPLPPSSPHPLWLFLQCSGTGWPRLVWGRGPRVRGGAVLGARPTSGGTRQFCSMTLFGAVLVFLFFPPVFLSSIEYLFQELHMSSSGN